MNIPDDIRRTVTDIADKAVEKGRQIGKEAQLQMQTKSLQVEHARKIHELGKRTYDWYRSGTMIVSGPVPREVVDVCASLDETQRKLDATQRELEAAREAARLAAIKQNTAGNTQHSTQHLSTPPALKPPADSDAPPHA
jgi:hypothetical protein